MTFLPAKRLLLASTAARGTADEGSMMIFILSHTSRMASIICSSVTVSMSSTFSLMTVNVLSQSEVSSPSAIVVGGSGGWRMPVWNDRAASSARAGSAP